MQQFDEAFQQIERPFAFINMDALQANVAYVNKQCGEKAVRVATKSIRSIYVLNYLKRTLKNFAGFMTFTAAETLYLLDQQFDQLLIGYPTLEREAIEKIALHVKAGKDVTFMVDELEQVALLQSVAQNEGVQLRICVDVNVSSNYKLLYFGTKRSPIYSLEHVQAFVQQLAQYKSLQLVGCMLYDAQVAGVTDATGHLFGMKDQLVQQLKKHSFKHVSKQTERIATYLQQRHRHFFVNGGGSGSMHLLKESKHVTEITVGSAFYAPALFSQYKSLQLQPAAGFALRITRQFDESTFVCQGGGYIASGAPANDRQPVFWEPAHYAFTALEGAGEVQTPIVVKGRTHQIGDTIYFRHAKAGELCERFNELHVVHNGEYKGAIQTYRGDGQCFL